MTIQNIEDVMERIMSLNRNLTEDSLKILLSASGWDREDINEGIRIFRITNKNTVMTSPIVSSQTIDGNTGLNTENVDVNKQTKNDNSYTFNLNRDNKNITNAPVANADIATSDQNINKIDNNLEIPKKPIDADNTQSAISSNNVLASQNQNDNVIEPHHANIGKIIFFVLVLSIIGLLLAYLFLPSFTDSVDKKFFNQNTKPVTDNSQEIKPVNSATNNVTENLNIINATATNISTSIEDSKYISKLDNLAKDIEELKKEFEMFKKSSTGSTKTIVKYISQKGPAGSAGRGISNVSSTSTGFIINYTDNTSVLIPYSTSTILSILNSKSVCFIDQNIVATSTLQGDVCLDRAAVLKLLNK